MSEILDLGPGRARRSGSTSPILLAALAGLFTDRAGIFNIGLEGQVLVGAFFGVAGLYWTKSAWAGLGLAVVAATALSLLFGLWVIKLGGDAIIVGLAVEPARGGADRVPDAAGVRRTRIVRRPGAPGAAGALGLLAARLPRRAARAGCVVGGCSSTRSACGCERWGRTPRRQRARHRPDRMKFAGCAICGVLCGLAGGQLALSLVTQWVEGMSAGRGFVALVALMLARSHPIGVGLAAALFGFAYALAVRLQGQGIRRSPLTPPDVLTIVALVLLAWRARVKVRTA